MCEELYHIVYIVLFMYRSYQHVAGLAKQKGKEVQEHIVAGTPNKLQRAMCLSLSLLETSMLMGNLSYYVKASVGLHKGFQKLWQFTIDFGCGFIADLLIFLAMNRVNACKITVLSSNV